MRPSRLLALALTTAVLGSTAGAVHATPSESQRLRGMEGRTFAVTVTGLGDPFQNCYTFDNGGGWTDQFAALFLGIEGGTWEQSRVGASTSYTASAGPIEQHGTVTPAGGSGVLQLHATTVVTFPGDQVELTSVGQEDPDCTIAS